jgi:integrase
LPLGKKQGYPQENLINFDHLHANRSALKLAPPIATPEDVGRLLAELLKIAVDTRRPSLFALFAFLLYTGARKGEAIGLRLGDIDLKGHMVTLRHSYQGTTKNAKHRPVPIPPDLLPILRRQRLADPWKGGPDHLAFPNETGEMWSKNARIREVLHLACDRSGIPRIKVHDLRHTYAAFYLMAGGNLYDLQKNRLS